MTLGEPCTMAISESHVLGSVGSASFESRDAPISLRVLSQSLGVGWILRSAPDKMYRSQTMCFSSAIADEPLTSLLLARNSSLAGSAARFQGTERGAKCLAFYRPQRSRLIGFVSTLQPQSTVLSRRYTERCWSRSWLVT